MSRLAFTAAALLGCFVVAPPLVLLGAPILMRAVGWRARETVPYCGHVNGELLPCDRRTAMVWITPEEAAGR